MANTPQLRGQVTYVATDRTDSADGRHSYYAVRVTIDPAQLRAARLDLRSGMPAETHIETTSRSLLSYMFKPLRDQFARAFTDN
jgi:HlyD family secretion protein